MALLSVHPRGADTSHPSHEKKGGYPLLRPAVCGTFVLVALVASLFADEYFLPKTEKKRWKQ